MIHLENKCFKMNQKEAIIKEGNIQRMGVVGLRGPSRGIHFDKEKRLE